VFENAVMLYGNPPDGEAKPTRPNWTSESAAGRRMTWRLVIARVSGRWRWAVIRDWLPDGAGGWVCHVEWSDDVVRGGAGGGWFEYDPRWFQPVPAPPADWLPPGEDPAPDRSPGHGGIDPP
jgi:hypothetical protein